MTSTILLDSLRVWQPEAMLSAGALLVLLIGAWGEERAKLAQGVAWITLAASGCCLLVAQPATTPSFFGFIFLDAFALAMRWIALGSVALTLLLLTASHDVKPSVRAESIGLLLLVGVGLMLMAEAHHLLMAYLAMELVSLGSYVLVGFPDEPRAAEGALKYLLFGAMSSGIMLFGMSLLFGATGALAFPDLGRAVAALSPAAHGTVLIAVALLLAGLAFKISMVPFHMWTPDVYEGAPVPVTAFLSVGPKAAGFALLLRITSALKPAWPALGPLILALTLVTMTFGNLAALTQTNVKRLLAYSTIGQVGYLLIGFAVGTPEGFSGILFYLVAYLFMNVGAFACVVAVVNETGSESLDAFRGLARRAPALACFCAIFLLSLAGMPPLLGFFGKFLLFGAALSAHQPILAIAGILNSAIALYYYVNIIRLMYLLAPSTAAPLIPPAAIRWAVAVCAAATLLFGLFPGPLLDGIRSSRIANLL